MSAKAVSGAQAVSIRDALYEAPGPKTRAKIRVGTAVSAVLQPFCSASPSTSSGPPVSSTQGTGMFFTEASTWSYLFAGLRGTLAVALTAGAIALVLGLLLMLGRTSGAVPLAALCRVVTDFFRGVPSLLLIYFFFLVVPQYGIRMSSFWMITLPVALAASGVLAARCSAPASTPCRAVRPRRPSPWGCAPSGSSSRSCCPRRSAT